MANRFLDPMAPARTFAARRAGMTDGRKLRRDLQRIKRRVAPSFGGEDVPAEWTMIEEVDELPEADDDTIGRIFIKKNAEADDVIEIGLTDADGEPILVGLNTLGNTNEIDLTLATAFSTGVAVSDIEAIAIDAGGDLWIVDDNNNEVYEYDTSGTLLNTFGTFGSGNGQIDSPRGIAFDASGNIYIGDTGNERVQKLTSAFAYVSQFGTAGTGAQQFSEIAAIDVNTTTGRIYVLDVSLEKVEVYTSAHAYVGMIGGPADFSAPEDVAVDAVADEVYVCDRNNGRIRVYDGTTLAHVRDFGSSGNADGQLDDPRGVHVDSSTGRVYVADTGNNRVQIFDGATGEYLAKFGTSGSASGQLTLPNKVAVASDGSAYITETANTNDRVSSLVESSPVPTTGTAGDTLIHNGTAWIRGPRMLEASATYNPPSLAANAGVVPPDITVTGAAQGDFCQASHTSVERAFEVNCSIVAADTCRVVMTNRAPTVDLPSGTLTCRVFKRIY